MGSCALQLGDHFQGTIFRSILDLMLDTYSCNPRSSRAFQLSRALLHIYIYICIYDLYICTHKYMYNCYLPSQWIMMRKCRIPCENKVHFGKGPAILATALIWGAERAPLIWLGKMSIEHPAFKPCWRTQDLGCSIAKPKSSHAEKAPAPQIMVCSA